MSELVKVQRRDVIAIVAIDNPKTRNALSAEMLVALTEQFDALSNDDGCRAIVLTGAGEHFCSGGDLSGMKEERTIGTSRRRNAIGQRITRSIASNNKPVIAAVEGYAAGAGLSLAAAADYVVSSATAKYVSSFGKVGILPDLGLMWTLPQRIGLAQAKRMFMSVCVVDAAEARTLGLSDHNVEAGKALEAAVEIARSFTVAAPLATAALKYVYAKNGCDSLEDALRNEVEIQPGLFTTDDHREAVAAFLEKRAPQFKGR